MMDFADEAQALSDTYLEAALQKSRKTLTLPFSGFCLCCKEPVQERRFCDSDCRETYETNLKRKFVGA